MEINVRRESKIVEIWLTREEKQDTALLERLKPLYQSYKEQGYMTAGAQNLWDTTSALLCYNRRRTAQLEVEQQKLNGVVMGM